MEASNHSSDAFTSHFSAAYASAQAESKEAAISQAAAAAGGPVTPAQAADMIGASLTSHIATELVAAASQAQAAANAANGGNDNANNSALHAESTAVGNTVLAAAAVVAANEVQVRFKFFEKIFAII